MSAVICKVWTWLNCEPFWPAAGMLFLKVIPLCRKLFGRTQRQKGILSQPDLANIEKRAVSAPLELQLAWQFDHIIPNHDGEDHEHWSSFYYPVGDALRSLLSLAAILRGQEAPDAERWEKDLWPGSV